MMNSMSPAKFLKWMFLDAFTLWGDGGSGGSGTQTSTNYTSNMPEYAKPYYTELLKQTGKETFATDSSGKVTGIKPWQSYAGERVAGFNPDQQQVQSEVMGLQTPGEFGQASSGLNVGQQLGFGAAGAGLNQALNYDPNSARMFGGDAAAYYMSPYAQNVIDINKREAQHTADVQGANKAMGAVTRGTFGGARQALARSEDVRNTNQLMADIQNKGMQDAYTNAQTQFNADQQRQQQAQQYAATLGKELFTTGETAGIDTSKGLGALAATQQTAELERLKAQAATAEEKQALQQKIDDVQYQTAMEQRDWNQKMLEFYSNILRGNANALGSTQISYAPAPSMLSQLGGAGLAGLGLYNTMKG